MVHLLLRCVLGRRDCGSELVQREISPLWRPERKNFRIKLAAMEENVLETEPIPADEEVSATVLADLHDLHFNYTTRDAACKYYLTL